MQLSPLQSRLAASAMASCVLIILYIFFFAPQFASAAEPAQPPIGLDFDTDGFFSPTADAGDSLSIRDPEYNPDFSLFDRSIIGRVSGGTTPIDADSPIKSNIEPGVTMAYIFQVASVSSRSAQVPEKSYELRRDLNGTQVVAEGEGDGDDELKFETGLARRQEPSKTIYISANTCNQPTRISPNQTTVDPPQLTLFVSTSSDNTSPGPGQSQDTQKTIVFDEGAVMFNTSLDHDVYFSISAPQVPAQYFTTPSLYVYTVAVSLDGYYYAYDDESQPDLFWVDSDASSAFLTTRNLTSDSQMEITTPPYEVFVQSTENLGINGLRKSYCGLSGQAQIRPLQDGNSQAMVGLRRGGADNLTMEEVYIPGLNASTNYTAIISSSRNLTLSKRQENSSPNKGVTVFNGVGFSTKPNGACTFIFNLTLCTETQYAVPGNLTNFPNGTALAAFYDDYTQQMWDNFDKVLQQTPCEAPAAQRYSLAKDCDDCKKAYKDWLCSVAIPRCEDFSSPAEHLQMRNINAPFANGSLVDPKIRDDFGDLLAFNSSRNPEIDSQIQPGPYKEVLPCDYLCYELVKSCPASIGFACPLPSSKYGFKTSYAVPNVNEELSCNYPGSAHFPDAAGVLAVSWVGMTTAIITSLLLTW